MVCARFCIAKSILLHDQLRMENAAAFGQGNKEFGQGKVSEKSGNFTFFDVWKPCSGIHDNGYGFCLFCSSIHMFVHSYFLE